MPSGKMLLSDPKCIFWKKTQKWKGEGPACWIWGDEDWGGQVVNGVIVPQPRGKGGAGENPEERFSSFLEKQAGESGMWGGRPQPCHLGRERRGWPSRAGPGEEGLALAALQS